MHELFLMQCLLYVNGIFNFAKQTIKESSLKTEHAPRVKCGLQNV